MNVRIQVLDAHAAGQKLHGTGDTVSTTCINTLNQS